jgi:chromosome segregation ATPase
MSPSNLLELAIIAFIVLGIAAAIWRGGAQNPVGTGGLNTQLIEVKAKLGEIETRVEAVETKAASTEDIERLEEAVGRLAQTLPDIEARQRALSDKVGKHAATSAATAAEVKHISKQVDLIYSVLVPKGMEK